MRNRIRAAGLRAVRGALFGANDNRRFANDNLRASERVRGVRGRISAS